MVPEILGDLTQKFDDLWQTRPGQQTVCDIENGPVEIVDLPSYKMVDFPIVFCMFTRGYMPNDHDIPMKSYAGCVLPEAQRLAGAAVEWLKQGKSPTCLSHG